jgi:hypothetical protein
MAAISRQNINKSREHGGKEPSRDDCIEKITAGLHSNAWPNNKSGAALLTNSF